MVSSLQKMSRRRRTQRYVLFSLFHNRTKWKCVATCLVSLEFEANVNFISVTM